MRLKTLAITTVMFLTFNADAQWRTVSFTDAFGEITGIGATSEYTKPIKPMTGLFSMAKAALFVNCDFAWISFNSSPMLQEAEEGSFMSEYETHVVRVRLKGKPERRWRVKRKSGSKDLVFEDSIEVLETFKREREIAIAVNWMSNGYTAFRWSLEGARDAIKKSCSSGTAP